MSELLTLIPIEKIGEPITGTRNDGSTWTKYTYMFRDKETGAQKKMGIFKELELNKEYKGFEKQAARSDWDSVFVLERIGGKDRTAIAEAARLKRESSMRQTCLNNAVEIVTSLMRLTTLQDSEIFLGDTTFDINSYIRFYFKMFMAMLEKPEKIDAKKPNIVIPPDESE